MADTKVRDDLEHLVDKEGLGVVLSLLSEICVEKVLHVRSAWQDETLGREWVRYAKLLDKASCKVSL